jgi:O-acetylserine/cysteine efflux transporter
VRIGHVGLAVLVAVLWGAAFVATKIGLGSFSPSELVAVRFLVAAAPAAFLPRPAVPWSVLVWLGLTLFTGQFLFQFFGMASGMPPGLTSVVVQTQALFTILFSALALREKPAARQLGGVAIAFAGLALIAVTVGRDATVAGFALTLASAVSWGVGNVFMKRVGRVEMLHLVVWLSLVPPLPALVLSMLVDGPDALPHAVARASAPALGAVVYLGLVATVLAYAIWGALLRRYPAAVVTPFALLAPFVAAYSSSLVFGETFGGLRVAGMALVLLGLAVIVLPLGMIRSRRGVPVCADGPLPVLPATRTDAAEVIALIGRVYAEYGLIYDAPTEVPDLLAFDAHYTAPHGAFFVVRQDGRLVGSVGVERVDAERAELHRLYLDADLRGRGTGRALVETVLDWCRAHTVPRLFLWSDTQFDRAHRLYTRMGFQLTGERTLPNDVNQTREYRFERRV